MVQAFRNERASKRHIPRILLTLVKEMHHVKLKNELIRFAENYESKDFSKYRDPLKAEYEFVLDFLSIIMETLFGIRQAKRIGLAQRVERHRLEYGDYRDHFIHPFQVFLLGLVMIDSHNAKFKNLMRSQDFGHLEEAWLLASIFHDILEPLEHAEWLGEDEGLEIGVNFRKWKEILALLATTYRKCGHKKNKAKQLEQILMDRYETAEKNHGVLAALDMINCISGVNIEKTPRHVATAAQCVALHDKKIWNDLVRAGIMPLTIEEDPIAYLLVYCDAVQEWGRPGKKSKESVGLMGVNMRKDNVQCVLFFEDAKDATSKLAEIQLVRKHLRATSMKWEILVTAV